MMDKRTARKKNRVYFMAALDKLRADLPARLASADFQTRKLIGGTDIKGVDNSGIRVYLRARPLFGYESARDEFNIVTVPACTTTTTTTTTSSSSSSSAVSYVLIHNCQMHADMKRMLIKHIKFPCDFAFGDTATNKEVYGRAAAPLVRQAASGKIATIFMYGQTGSGKTFTMGGIEELAAVDLFVQLKKMQDFEPQVTIAFFELAGKRCFDLLSSEQAEVRLMDRGDKGMNIVGGEQFTVSNSDQLLRIMHMGHARRSTDATDVNATSSRSHAVCQLTIHKRNGQRGGVLTLVDCAGSERNEDSMYHSKERRKEAAEINSSLHALKECIRSTMLKAAAKLSGKHKHVHVPFRSSNLTKVLMESFVREDAELAVISTLSPSTTDTEHSIGTLQTACMLAGRENMVTEATESVERQSSQPAAVMIVPPVKWTGPEVQDFFARGKFTAFAHLFPNGMDGKQLFRMPAAKLGLLMNNEKAGIELHAALQAIANKEKEQRKQRLKDNKALADREKHGW